MTDRPIVAVNLTPALQQESRAFDTPLGSVGFPLPAGVCYRALRRLPGQDFHLQDQRDFQDAPSGHFNTDAISRTGVLVRRLLSTEC